jgi:hypothetical protein
VTPNWKPIDNESLTAVFGADPTRPPHPFQSGDVIAVTHHDGRVEVVEAAYCWWHMVTLRAPVPMVAVYGTHDGRPAQFHYRAADCELLHGAPR